MTNADDSPPSGSDDGNNRESQTGGGEESASTPSGAELGESRRESEPSPDSETPGASEENSSGELNLPSPTELASEDDSDATEGQASEESDGGTSLPSPTSAGPASSERTEDAPPSGETDRSSESQPPPSVEGAPTDKTSEMRASHLPLRSEKDDTPVDSTAPQPDSESRPGSGPGPEGDIPSDDNAFEEGAFDEARGRDRNPGEEFAEEESEEYDVGPTRISDEIAFDAREDSEKEATGAANESGGLDSLAREMEEAEEAGELHDENALEMDATIDESAFQRQGDGATNVSKPDFEFDDTDRDPEGDSSPAAPISGETEAGTDSPPASHPQATSRPTEQERSGRTSAGSAHPENPPPPEQTGRGNLNRSAEASEQEAVSTQDPAGEEFADQETELFDSPFENDPIYPRLSVLDGPSSGQDYLLKDSRNLVGRSTKNGVVLPDEAMSRQHVEIVKNPDETYTIRDLQSVNGTFVNGTKIEEADLFHGDRIEMGKTTVQFVVPGRSSPPPNRDRQIVPAEEEDDANVAKGREPSSAVPSRGSTHDTWTIWLNRIIIGASVLMVPLAGVFLYLTLYGSSQRSPAARESAEAARKAYFKGIEAVGARNWSEAHDHFERARNIDSDLSNLQAQFDRIETEKKARKHLEQARSLLEDGETKRAVERLRSIPDESVYYEEARDILRREKRRQRIASLYEEAAENFEEGQNQSALATIQRILGTVPNHDSALTLRRKILSNSNADLEEARKKAEKKEEKRREEEEPAEPTSHRAEAAGSSSSTDDSSEQESTMSWLLDDSSEEESNGTSEGGSGGAGGVNFTEGFALYRHEKFDAAIEHFRKAKERGSGVVRRRAGETAEKIEAFRKSYRAGNTALESGDYRAASELFREALRHDKEVSSEGYFESDLDRRIAEAHAGRGLELHENGEYSEAYRRLEQAGHYDDSHPKVRELKRRLEKKATSLYIQAKAKRKTNPGEAASICRTIMSIVSKENETYQKAQKLLDGI